MDAPVLVILGVLATGALFVLIPIALTSAAEHRSPRSLLCPETGSPAKIGVDVGRAVRGALVGKRWLRVESCTLWPGKTGCAQACLRAENDPRSSEIPPNPPPA